MKKVLKVLYALALALFVICDSVILTVCFKSLYYGDIRRFELVEKTGMSEEEIKENYDEMIRFLIRFGSDELTLPTLPMSEGGKIHFADVKHLFNGVKILAVVSLAASVACFVALMKEDRSRSLTAAGVITLGIPALLGAFVAIDWQKFFVLFHKTFFRNDYWIFDARTDPVITILPDGFFMHCMIMIVVLVAFNAVFLFLFGMIQRRKYRGE